MSIDQLVNLPARSQAPATFIANADALFPQLNTFANQANALAAAMSSVAAGTAFAIPYLFSTTTTDSDPGSGVLRLDNATQNLATTIRCDLLGADAADYTSIIDSFDGSSNAIKGQIRLSKLGDATKWIACNVTARAAPAGYRNLTVTVVGASGASPFSNGDSILLAFSRAGDVGAAGGGISIAYAFDNGTTAADPGAGKLRFNNATQNSTTHAYLNTSDSSGKSWTSVLNTLDASSSTVKGQLRIFKINDPTQFLLFNVTARTTPSYVDLALTNTGSSTNSPFANGDAIVMTFSRSGDAGTNGSPGALTLLAPPITPTVAATVDALNVFSATYDNYRIVIDGVKPAADDTLILRLANSGTVDAGSNYIAGSIENGGSTAFTSTATSQVISATVTAAGIGGSFVIDVLNVNSAGGLKLVSSYGTSQSAATPAYTPIGKSSVYKGGVASGFRLLWNSASNFSATGSIRIYGYQNS